MALGLVESEEERAKDEEAVDEALAGFGLYALRAPVEVAPLYLWPENLASWNLFQECSSQWMRDEQGKSGLNYPGVEVVLRMAGLKKRQLPKVFHDIQAMEWAALSAWKEKNE